MRMQAINAKILTVSLASALVTACATDLQNAPITSRAGTEMTTSFAPIEKSSGGDDYDFWISKALFKDIEDQGIMYTLKDATLEAASGVHPLADDCELHIATTPSSTNLAAPHMFVVEPPNLCKTKPPSGSGAKGWSAYVQNELIGNVCDVTGFPRILDEHLKGEESDTNPHHMLEIHPALKIKCPHATLDASSYLKHYDGMREMKASSAAKCFETTVRVRDGGKNDRWEFEVNRPPSCGNFASFEMSVFTEWIRAPHTGGHSAIARVKVEGEDASKTLKIYTLPGTAEDALLEDWMKSGKPHHGAWFHGMTTIDYFAIGKVLHDKDGKAKDVSDWTDVPFPLALVLFGRVKDPHPDHDEDEAFDE